MQNKTLVERAELYHQAFPNYPPLRADQRWIDGMWIMGNNYRGTGFYGSYPPQYLARMNSMFPDAEQVLHLFSGSLPKGNYVRLDNRQDADVHGEANQLSTLFSPETFDLIFADPPYSIEDAEHYGAPMINRNEVLKQCAIVLKPEGYVVWLDQVLPMFSKQNLHLCGVIGVVRSTNHRFRVASIFKKVRCST